MEITKNVEQCKENEQRMSDGWNGWAVECDGMDGHSLQFNEWHVIGHWVIDDIAYVFGFDNFFDEFKNFFKKN